jgi:flagellar hook protein FlgE
MLRSLYTAVSGVRAHQTYLDVTGNNIANVNTVGFKRDVIQFRDMIYQDFKGASTPDSAVPIGGINPAQVGLGVQVGSIETVHTNGSFQTTGIPTDIAISGNGFFVLKNGGQQLYTRAGNFALDRDGNLVSSGSGYLVQGYKYEYQLKDPSDPSLGRELVKSSSLSNVNIPLGQKIEAKATDIVSLKCNLCSSASIYVPPSSGDPGIEASNTWSTKGDVYDSKGTKYTMEVAFRKTDENTWEYKAFFVDDEGKIYNGTATGAGYQAGPPPVMGPDLGCVVGILEFSTDGLLQNMSSASGTYTAPPTIPGLPSPPAISSPPTESEGYALFSSIMFPGATPGNIKIDFLGEATEAATGVSKKDSGLDGVTQYDSTPTTKIYYQDGYTMGELQDFTVGSDGTITGSYSNGKSLALAQVALATFANEGGLQKVGETNFVETTNSGIPIIGGPMEGSAGSVQGSTIEMSNTDLSEEFVNLIRAQRGFQANTRVVTTSDQVLEELINMKR